MLTPGAAKVKKRRGDLVGHQGQRVPLRLTVPTWVQVCPRALLQVLSFYISLSFTVNKAWIMPNNILGKPGKLLRIPATQITTFAHCWGREEGNGPSTKRLRKSFYRQATRILNKSTALKLPNHTSIFIITVFFMHKLKELYLMIS